MRLLGLEFRCATSWFSEVLSWKVVIQRSSWRASQSISTNPFGVSFFFQYGLPAIIIIQEYRINVHSSKVSTTSQSKIQVFPDPRDLIYKLLPLLPTTPSNSFITTPAPIRPIASAIAIPVDWSTPDRHRR